jgi:hypothetical protein
MQIGLTPARERKLVRRRADDIQRAMAAVYLAVEDLPPRDGLLAVNKVLEDMLENYRRADAERLRRPF